MRVLKSAVVCALLSTACFCTTSFAAVIDVTYTGFVASGFDTAGLFGNVGADLTGDAYATTYRFDTSLGRFNNGQVSGAIGGPAFANYSGSTPGATSPSLGYTFTLNGISLTGLGAYGGAALAGNVNLFSAQEHEAVDRGQVAPAIGVENEIGAPSSVIPGNVDTPYFYQVSAGGSGTGAAVFENSAGLSTNLFLAPNTIQVADISSGVPEPSTWAMMLLGFGGLGFLAYRKTRKGDAGTALLAA